MGFYDNYRAPLNSTVSLYFKKTNLKNWSHKHFYEQTNIIDLKQATLVWYEDLFTIKSLPGSLLSDKLFDAIIKRKMADMSNVNEKRRKYAEDDVHTNSVLASAELLKCSFDHHSKYTKQKLGAPGISAPPNAPVGASAVNQDNEFFEEASTTSEKAKTFNDEYVNSWIYGSAQSSQIDHTLPPLPIQSTTEYADFFENEAEVIENEEALISKRPHENEEAVASKKQRQTRHGRNVPNYCESNKPEYEPKKKSNTRYSQMTESQQSATLYLTPPMTEIAESSSSNLDLGDLEGSKNKNATSQYVRDDFGSRESTPCPTRSATHTLIATPNMTPNINQEHVNNNQEPSLRRSPRKKRRVSYVEVDEEERVSSTASQSAESHPPRTPPQAPRDLSPLMNTPNKRPLESSEIQRYSKDIFVVCAFNKTVLELASEVGEELAIELSSTRDTNPALWSHALEKYLDTSLKETGKKFKTAIQVEIPNEPFRLYCEKVLLDFYNLVDINSTMDRNIGERKFITYQISSILKFYERTFLNLSFDWIESHASSAKVTKSATNSGIVKVDSKATRHLDGQEIWHMEVAGGPCKTTDLHTLGDTKKTMRMDVLNLIGILRNHFDCDIKLATKIKVFCTQVIGARMTLYALSMLPDGRFLSTELATALIPFSFQGRNQYKALLRLMAIFHDEIIKQEELMGEIERSVLRSKGVTVRHVLNIPDELFDINED